MMKDNLMNKHLKYTCLALGFAASPALADVELSVYLGVQTTQESTGSGVLPNGTAFSNSFDWEGRPLENPFYYGARALYWTDNDLGFGLEFTHAKAYSDATGRGANFSRLEFTDGHNIVTANIMKRWPGFFAGAANITPYVGGGIGVAIPHVDVQATGTARRTFGLEVTGPAARGIAGLKYDFSERWALFGEYQVTWSDNDATIDPDAGQTAGSFETTLVTHAVNFGISYNF